MATLTIQDVSRHCGLSEPTLHYYEEVGLIGPIGRGEPASGGGCRWPGGAAMNPVVVTGVSGYTATRQNEAMPGGTARPARFLGRPRLTAWTAPQPVEATTVESVEGVLALGLMKEEQ